LRASVAVGGKVDKPGAPGEAEKPDPMQEMMGQLTQYIAQASGPKRIVRGPDGRAVGVESA